MIEHNSRIIIFGVTKPIICSYKIASQINDIYLNPNVEREHPMKIGTTSFTKSAIRIIDVREDTDTDAEKSHWVIYSPKKKCIWKQPYRSLHEAQAELEFQQMSLPEGATTQLQKFSEQPLKLKKCNENNRTFFRHKIIQQSHG